MPEDLRHVASDEPRLAVAVERPEQVILEGEGNDRVHVLSC